MPDDDKELRRDRKSWVAWLKSFGAARFYDAFILTAQDAEGRCVRCGHVIYLDIRDGGGVPDWRTGAGDYGCYGSGCHVAQRLADAD